MSSTECNWQNHNDIDRWVKEWSEDPSHNYLEFTGKQDSIDELRHRHSRGDFVGEDQVSVASYLKKHDERVYRASPQGQADREERAVHAAEKSARWAGWAVAISIAALALAGWPYIKSLLD